ncbi:MAG: methionine gamma-lyase family protein, partial [Clostridia bacterium]|nr:methionine gamma-lyase family protein [Clostridia bacterium]
ELASYRLTSVGCGLEVGATLGQTKNMYKGLFYAPHTTAQALKTAALAAYLFEALGCTVEPRWNDDRFDIIQAVQCGTAEGLCAFCRGIQSGSPVDAFVTPEPWAMPGYKDEVIMAAGAFTQGSSIELSADGPLRPPFTAYLQGGLTYESGKYAIMRAADAMLAAKK